MSSLRLDRISLSSPTRGPDGSWRVRGVLVAVGDRLEYPHGVEIVTRDALSDEAYLDALRGLSLVRQEDHSGPVVIGDGVGRTVGHVIDAQLVGDELVVDMSITDPTTARDVLERRTASLSEAYRPRIEQRDGQSYQTGREPNHIAIVDRGRAPSARIQTDRGEHMDSEEIARIAREAAAQAVAAYRTDRDEAERIAELEAERDELKARVAELEVAKGAAEERLDAMADAALVERARVLGLSLPSSSTPATRLRDVASLIRPDLRADASDDYLQAVIDGAQAPEQRRDRAPTPIPAGQGLTLAAF